MDVGLEKTLGWVGPNGAFYPCEYYGHSQLMYDIMDADPGRYEGIRDFEDHFVKITTGGHQRYLFLKFGEKRLTARQKLTLSKLAEKHKMFEDGWSELLTSGDELVMRDGRATWRRYNERDQAG